MDIKASAQAHFFSPAQSGPLPFLEKSGAALPGRLNMGPPIFS